MIERDGNIPELDAGAGRTRSGATHRRTLLPVLIMSHLRDLQLRFQDYLIDGSEAIEADIVSTENALAEHRLGTYYNAYRIRLIDALATDFSALQQYLGREAFENLILDYLHHYPSTHPSVRWVRQTSDRLLAAALSRRGRRIPARAGTVRVGPGKRVRRRRQ